MKKLLSTKAVGILALGLMLSAGVLFAGAPLDAIRDSNEKVKEVLNANAGNKLDDATEKKLRAIIEPATDFSAMSDAVLTVFPADTTPAQRAAFKKAFEELLLLSSVKKMGRYNADNFEYGGEKAAGANVTVSTTAIYSKKNGGTERIALDYTLTQKDGRWVIINYFTDGTSTIRNYQGQFKKIVSAKGVAAAIRQVEQTVAQYRISD
ncbi:MAG: ABC transporter substrate-binding protein [Spirochaetota bacterium]|jgi:phospholipid transport system substrate-binding protein|nr:ABC transporter substrate-binding protein [Spirochaetota bacterium]